MTSRFQFLSLGLRRRILSSIMSPNTSIYLHLHLHLHFSRSQSHPNPPDPLTQGSNPADRSKQTDRLSSRPGTPQYKHLPSPLCHLSQPTSLWPPRFVFPRKAAGGMFSRSDFFSSRSIWLDAQNFVQPSAVKPAFNSAANSVLGIFVEKFAGLSFLFCDFCQLCCTRRFACNQYFF